MICIHRTSNSDICAGLPAIRPLDDSAYAHFGQVDLLICAAGFEDRASAVADVANVLKPTSVVILRYPTNERDNARSLSRLSAIAPKSKTIELLYDKREFRNVLRRHIRGMNLARTRRVVLDATVMSSYLLYRVLSAIWEFKETIELYVYYCEAKDYFPSSVDWKETWDRARSIEDQQERAERYEATRFQSDGVEATYISEDFPGRNVASLPTRVIAIPNFSRIRMSQMLAFTEQQYNAPWEHALWVLGSPPDRAQNGWRLDALAELYQVRSNFTPVSTLDYKEMLWVLSDFWESLNLESHFVIASLGSKMQHLGTFLFLRMHPDVGLILSEPRSFVADRYSSGIGKQWWIPFGSISTVDELLRTYGKMNFNW